jgi:hypothetical protein
MGEIDSRLQQTQRCVSTLWVENGYRIEHLFRFFVVPEGVGFSTALYSICVSSHPLYNNEPGEVMLH